jgi:hypothetical protein
MNLDYHDMQALICPCSKEHREQWLYLSIKNDKKNKTTKNKTKQNTLSILRHLLWDSI